MERWEEAVKCFQQVAEIYARLQNQLYEGVARSNLADTLIKLGRYSEARMDTHRAIECDQPYGHAAQPWKAWAILCNLERVTGNAQAAAQARERARILYLQYRRDGGESFTSGAKLCVAVLQGIEQGQETILAESLNIYSGEEIQDSNSSLIAKLQAILQGERSPSLADDAALKFDDSVELLLLLEFLNKKGEETL